MDKSGHREDVRHSGGRAQSETLGFVLVFSIMLLGALVVVALGAYAISDTQDEIGDDRAEQALTQFDAQAALVALGEADSQRISFASDDEGDFHVREDRGWMNVSIQNRTDGNVIKVMEVRLGALTYEGGDQQMAYQGGGVWRATDQGGQMISPPEFHFRNGTLTLPAISVTGDIGHGSDLDLAGGETTTAFPRDADDFRTNPLDNHIVEITVQSEFYRGWGSYFEQRTDGEVEYESGTNTVILTLKTPVGERSIEEAVTATSADGDFFLAGSGAGPDIIADSYNSSAGSYSETAGSQGNITVGGDFELTGNHKTVDGNVRTGGEFICTGSTKTVTGDVFYQSSDIGNNCNIHGEEHSPTSVATANPLNTFVNNTVNELNGENNNSNTPVEGENLDSGPSTLYAGDYYVESLDVDDPLTLETNDEILRIGVDQYVDISSTVDIIGDGKVEIYVRGDGTTGGNHFQMDGATITTSGERENSTNFWVYGNDDMQTFIGDGSHLEGVVYAPTNAHGTSFVEIDEGVVFGGLVAAAVNLEQGHAGAIHFDEALGSMQAVPEDTSVPTITYLHMTENELIVDG